MGTSSILSGALLASLWHLKGFEFNDALLVETVFFFCDFLEFFCKILESFFIFCLFLNDKILKILKLYHFYVLKIEQLHGSGGGWQDQVGGCTKNGGLKLGSILRKNKLTWINIPISMELRKKIEKQLILIYTGETRLAKNLLQVRQALLQIK